MLIFFAGSRLTVFPSKRLGELIFRTRGDGKVLVLRGGASFPLEGQAWMENGVRCGTDFPIDPGRPEQSPSSFMEDAAYFVEFPFEDLHPSAELDRAKAVMKSDREGGWHLRIPRFSIVMEMPDDFRPWDAVHGS